MLLILWRGAKVQKDMVVDSSITLLKNFLLPFFLLSLRLISFYLRIMSTRSCYVRNSNSPAPAARLAQTWALAGYCFQFSVPKSPFLSDKFILQTSSLQLAASRRFWFIDYRRKRKVLLWNLFRQLKLKVYLACILDRYIMFECDTYNVLR